MNQFIAMIISTATVGLVMVETIDSFNADSVALDETFTTIHYLHEIRDYKHKQYAKVTKSDPKNFQTPYHLTSEDIDQLEVKIRNIIPKDYSL